MSEITGLLTLLVIIIISWIAMICLIVFSPLLCINLIIERCKKWKLHGYWMKKQQDIHLIPCVQFKIEEDHFYYNIVLDALYLNRWCTLELSKRKEAKHV